MTDRPPLSSVVSGTDGGASLLLKEFLQQAAHHLGYHIGRFPARESYESQIGRFLRHLGVNCVLDVGAHEGEFYATLRSAGYSGRIVSFEPVPESFRRLQTTTAGDPLWRGYNLALGRDPGRLAINVPDSTAFASFLQPNDFMETRFPHAHWDGSGVEVQVERLGTLLDDTTAGIDQPRIFLKMDTQGWDAAVIAGAGGDLENVVALQSEMSVKPIYEGMEALPDSLARYLALGFELVNLFPVTYDSDDVSVIEFDCLLRRRGSLSHRLRSSL